MRKPTRLGYCTTCDTKIWVFDVNGIPFKRRDNYCEVIFDLSDGSRGRLAFCKKCVEQGVDAQEAIANALDGKAEEVSKKNWSQDFKDWHLGIYRELKPMTVHQILEITSRGLTPVKDDILGPKEKVGEVKNLHRGPVVPRKWTMPPDLSGLGRGNDHSR